jgi:type 1 fimbria pilin
MTKITLVSDTAESMRAPGICGLLLVLLCLLASPLRAQETLIWTFNATIASRTCNVESPLPVDLKPVTLGALPSPDSTAEPVRIVLKIKDCDPSITSARFTFIAHPDSNKPNYFKADTGPNAASGIAFRLTDDSGKMIGANGTDNTVDTLVSNKVSELGVTVAYVRTTSAAMRPGDVDGHIEFDVDYP